MASATLRTMALPPPTAAARRLNQPASSSTRLSSLGTVLRPRTSSPLRHCHLRAAHSTMFVGADCTGLPREASSFSRILCVCKAGRSDIHSKLELERNGKQPGRRANGVFWIILLNLGKLVEEEEGTLGLWISYAVTGIGANIVSWLVLPSSSVSVGASGAVFGLFAVSVLVKMSWDWRKILEVLILGQFVIERVLEAAQASTGMVVGRGSSMVNVNHISHLSGALIGAGLIYLVSRVSSQSLGKDITSSEGR